MAFNIGDKVTPTVDIVVSGGLVLELSKHEGTVTDRNLQRVLTDGTEWYVYFVQFDEPIVATSGDVSYSQQSFWLDEEDFGNMAPGAEPLDLVAIEATHTTAKLETNTAKTEIENIASSVVGSVHGDNIRTILNIVTTHSSTLEIANTEQAPGSTDTKSRLLSSDAKILQELAQNQLAVDDILSSELNKRKTDLVNSQVQEALGRDSSELDMQAYVQQTDKRDPYTANPALGSEAPKDSDLIDLDSKYPNQQLEFPLAPEYETVDDFPVDKDE